jgi:hypothetical protein
MPFVRLSARGVRQFRKEQSGNQLRRRPGFGVGNMPDVDWLALSGLSLHKPQITSRSKLPSALFILTADWIFLN